jgi:hypothetical protein
MPAALTLPVKATIVAVVRVSAAIAFATRSVFRLRMMGPIVLRFLAYQYGQFGPHAIGPCE